MNISFGERKRLVLFIEKKIGATSYYWSTCKVYDIFLLDTIKT